MMGDSPRDVESGGQELRKVESLIDELLQLARGDDQGLHLYEFAYDDLKNAGLGDKDINKLYQSLFSHALELHKSAKKGAGKARRGEGMSDRMSDIVHDMLSGMDSHKVTRSFWQATEDISPSGATLDTAVEMKLLEFQQQIEQERQQQSELRGRLDELDAELKDARAATDSADAKRKRVEEELAANEERWKAQLSEAEDRERESKRVYEAEAEKAKKLSMQLEDAEQANHAKEEQLKRMRNDYELKLQQWDDRINSLSHEKDALESERAKLQREVNSMTQKAATYDALKQQYDDIDRDRARLQDQLNHAWEKNRETEEKLEEERVHRNEKLREKQSKVRDIAPACSFSSLLDGYECFLQFLFLTSD